MTVPDFSKIWASQSLLTPYKFSDEDYLDGWEFIGEIPPDRRMLDTWQRQADTKMQWLKNNMLGYLLRQNSTQYAVGDIAFSASLPSSLVLQCTAEGTTAASEPDFSGAVEGGTVTDGTVVWTYQKIVPTKFLTREQIPAVNHRDVITTSGTYTAPVSGWYKITAKGGGGGGGGGFEDGNSFVGGGGGGEGGTTIAYEYMNENDTASVVIGAGGTAGAYNTDGGNGGNSSVTVNSNTYTGGGGGGGVGSSGISGGGSGGIGTIIGAAGVSSDFTYSSSSAGGTGGGAGGGRGGRASAGEAGVSGGGGAGGANSSYSGRAGGDGYVWFEFFAAV